MLGEEVARQAGEALVADVCARAKANGCNLLEQPADKLTTYLKVRPQLGCCLQHACTVQYACTLWVCRHSPPLTALTFPVALISACPQGAFNRAHEASLCVYDDPPNSINYPCGNM